MGNELTETYWSRFADTYDANQEYVVGDELLGQIRLELDGLSDLGELVDLGCGTGYFTETIASKSSSVVATDLSDDLLTVARRRLSDASKIEFRKEDALQTTFQSETFDSAFAANLIHVVEAPKKVLEECHRILRSSGTLIIVTFTGHGMRLWEKIKMGLRFSRSWGRPPENVRSLSPRDLTSMMEEVGFTIQTSKLIGDRTKALFAIGKKSVAPTHTAD